MKASCAVIFAIGCSALSACNRPESKAGAPRETALAQAERGPILPEKVVLDNGLEIQDLDPGIEGPVADKGKIVTIHYTGWLQDETTVIDTTRNRQPLRFQLGEGTVLKGWDLGVEGMKLGGKRKLKVPPALAFGKRELGQIKPDSTLVFEVELVKVE